MPKGIYIRTKPVSVFTRQKMSEAAQKRPPTFLGKKHTQETRQKMSLVRLGKPGSNKGKKFSEITCNKISESGKGRTPWNKGLKLPHLSGENSGRWIKDRSLLVNRQERNDSAYYVWRRLIWQRDNFKCKIANQDCNGRIEAHHILEWKDYPELRYDINNGITLCQAHHPKKRAEVKRLEPVFQALVSETKE